MATKGFPVIPYDVTVGGTAIIGVKSFGTSNPQNTPILDRTDSDVYDTLLISTGAGNYSITLTMTDMLSALALCALTGDMVCKFKYVEKGALTVKVGTMTIQNTGGWSIPSEATINDQKGVVTVSGTCVSDDGTTNPISVSWGA